MSDQSHKSHRSRQSGPSANKKKKDSGGAEKKNPKAFAFNSSVKAKRLQSRDAEKEQRKLHVPKEDRATGEPAPYVVVVHGPPKVGKSLLIKSLVKHYTKHNISEVRGPITVVAGKQRRVQFVECPNDINSMIDAAKFADLVLLLIDGSYGFEMETFEFLNILQVHGFPKVMGVLTHLDKFKDVKKLRKTKQRLKHRFWTEIREGAKLFYLSGLIHGKYPKREVHNLARFISVMKHYPLSWRTTHPYLLVDRLEDVTPAEMVRLNKKCDRNITLYGYLRGCDLVRGSKVHIAGAGDFDLAGVTTLVDPCPLPSAAKKRGLRDKEKLFYAPMSGLGDLLYDKDAVYININDHLVQFSNVDDNGMETRKGNDNDVGQVLVKSLQNTKYSIDEKLEQGSIDVYARKSPYLESENNADAKDLLIRSENSKEREGEQGSPSISVQGNFDTTSGEGLSGKDKAVEGNNTYKSDPEDSDEESDYSQQDQFEKDDHNPFNYDLKEEVEFHSGRQRRKAISSSYEDNTNTEDSEGDDAVDSSSESSGESEDDLTLEDCEVGVSSKWKEHLSGRSMSRWNTNLDELVYGQPSLKSLKAVQAAEGSSESEDDDGDVFIPKGEREKKLSEKPGYENIDAECSSKLVNKAAAVDWSSEDLRMCIRERFRAGGKSSADGGEGETDYGDFEDMESGKVYKNPLKKDDGESKSYDPEIEERRLKKLALREQFEKQYPFCYQMKKKMRTRAASSTAINLMMVVFLTK
ncbi:ribosome biogenesis protein BMS1-like protein isoform X2 [Iris pallida]|uniref:Ribosome biogenesis protein BMS1-like protein isoform X2 n=1 Tax=Iris pallida TaxID=29817 RepID=A0AAX6FP01_IRIPA|nr:ribosome biogenesis protein BMS1-like protein isoform X2 [Iris pallida]